MTTFKPVHTLVTFAWVTATVVLASNNLNPPGSLCLDVRGAGMETAQGVCQSSDSECAGGLQCVDNDFDPLNSGICADRAWYGLNFAVVVDVEMGPTTEPACGAQAFLEWDTQALSFVSLETDPDGELGWSFALWQAVDEVAGTVDLAIVLPIGTTCNDAAGSFDGGTIARLTFVAVDAGETDGVTFRATDPPSGISGRLGFLPVSGCNGDSQPSGTGRLYIDPCPFDDPDDTDGDGVCESDDQCPGEDDVPDFNSDGVPDCLCGNGFRDGGEDCDDGGTEDGDGCAANCLYEGSVPTVSQWGMMVLSLMLLAGVTIRFGRRRPATA
ncbi:MAG: IPTL-CTERM sorting domain-containing protein [Phycisphaerae bacterium]